MGELTQIATRNAARGLPLRGRGQTVCTLDEPAQGACVYLTALSVPPGITGTVIRLDLMGELNGAKSRIATALLRHDDADKSDLLMAVSGFPAQRFHVEAYAIDPRVVLGVGIGSSSGGGAPVIHVSPRYVQAAADTPPSFLEHAQTVLPGRYDYATGAGAGVVNVPRGARVKSIYIIAAAPGGSVKIDQGGRAGGVVPVPTGVAFAEQFAKSGDDALAGPVTVTVVNAASYFVSWWD